jgi:hypothetical protein
VKPHEPQETDWILPARRGDERAWEHLTRLHQAAVFRLAYLLPGNLDDASESPVDK